MQKPISPISLLRKYKEVSSEDSQILIQERIIYMSAMIIESGDRDEDFNINNQITGFIEKINMRVINKKDIDFDEKIHMMAKCFDMLAAKNIRVHIFPFEKQLQLRALCLNNLSIIYKQNRQLEDSLKAVEASIKIEELLLQKNYQNAITNLSSTYVNKCVILSELKNHEEASETLTKSLTHLQEYLQKHKQQLSKKQIQDLEYTKMFAHFNLAVQYQHLGISKLAAQHFQVAYKEAKELGDWQIRGKVVEALKSLRKK